MVHLKGRDHEGRVGLKMVRNARAGVLHLELVFKQAEEIREFKDRPAIETHGAQAKKPLDREGQPRGLFTRGNASA
jgi:hypothetical protein